MASGTKFVQTGEGRAAHELGFVVHARYFEHEQLLSLRACTKLCRHCFSHAGNLEWFV